VVIPVVFGYIWLYSPAGVFLAGTAMAVVSLLLSLNVPPRPCRGNETVVGRISEVAAAAE
jgi:hypothetical protein